MTQQRKMNRITPLATQKNINAQFLKPWPVLLPLKNEQAEISQILSSLDTKLRSHTQKKRTLADLFRTLVHQLMTAQIRVHDVDLSGLGLEAQTGDFNGGNHAK